MKIAIGGDHAAFGAKNKLKDFIVTLGHEVVDFGTYSEQSCDYPEFGAKVAHAVADGACDVGVVLCTTGIGISISANKVDGIRCALCSDVHSAEMTRRHNDANVLAMGAGLLDEKTMQDILTTFLSTPFDGGERHVRRINKIALIEKGEL